jgi:hypothetical protein
MRLQSQSIFSHYKRCMRGIKVVGAICSAMAAGLMAFFVGLMVPVTLWDRFTGAKRHTESIEETVFIASTILGILLGIGAFSFVVRWLWPPKLERT